MTVEKIGITLIVPEGQAPVPVYQSGTGIETFASDVPYVLGDAHSLEAPVPVVVSPGPIYTAWNGSPVQAVPVTDMPSGDGPTPNVYVPNLQDFWTNEKRLTEYVTRFNLHGPNIVLEMCFLFEGDPVFTITHGADTLQVAEVRLDPASGQGCLVALSSDAATEVAALRVSATGGTFGGLFGRIRELDYAPSVLWSDSLVGSDQQYHTFTSPEVGEMVAVSIWKEGYIDSGKFTPTTKITNVWILDGEPVPYTTSPVEEPWVEVDPGVYAIDTPYRPRPSKLFDITFDEPVAAPLYWDFGATTDPGSITYSGVGNTTTNNNWVSGTVIGGNVTQMQERYNQTYTGGRVEGYGNSRVGTFRFYSNPTPHGCSVYRQAGQQETTYRNFYGRPWVALVVCLSGNPWVPLTMTAGDSGEWIGYSNGDIAYPPFNPPVGTISSQPHPDCELQALYVDDADGALVAIFQGDRQALVANLRAQVGSYNGVATDVSIFAGNTIVRFPAGFAGFSDGQAYTVIFSGH